MTRTSRPSASEGTRSIQRAVAVLRHVAAARPGGARLTEVSEKTALSPSTVHRILSCLVEEGLVRRDQTAHRYELDDTAFALGLPAFSPLIRACRVALERVVAETGECCTLVLRSGLDSISVDRVLGRHPLRGLTLVGGDRRPLGTSGGSVAILAHLPDEQLDDINRHNTPRLLAYGLDGAAVRAAVMQCRARGYAITPSRAAPGVGVMGAAIPRRAGGAFAALALIGPIHRFSGRGAARAAAILLDEADRLAALPALHGGFTTAAPMHQGDGVSTRRKRQASSP